MITLVWHLSVQSMLVGPLTATKHGVLAGWQYGRRGLLRSRSRWCQVTSQGTTQPGEEIRNAARWRR